VQWVVCNFTQQEQQNTGTVGLCSDFQTVDMVTEKEFWPVLPTLSLCNGPKMHCICLHTVPRMLMQEQYDDWVSFSGEFIHTADNGVYFLHTTITGILHNLKSKKNYPLICVEVAINIENHEAPEGSPKRESNGSFF
jgi:hypothetical protein